MQAQVAPTQSVADLLAHVWAHLNRRSSADLFKLVADLDASFSQVKILFLLEEAGEQSVKDVAAGLGLSLPAASRALDGLLQAFASDLSDAERAALRSALLPIVERIRRP
jgi:MarR family protein